MGFDHPSPPVPGAARSMGRLIWSRPSRWGRSRFQACVFPLVRVSVGLGRGSGRAGLLLQLLRPRTVVCLFLPTSCLGPSLCCRDRQAAGLTSAGSEVAGCSAQPCAAHPPLQENQVHQRIAELRKEGLWSLRRLPKLQEAPRPRAHWDYLLEEMQWMATDFAQERRWKVAAAKKVGGPRVPPPSLGRPSGHTGPRLAGTGRPG